MARARNIKPGFFTNEQLVELPFETRLLFIGLWTLADREGRLEDRPKKIKMEVFPADSVDVDSKLGELEKAGFIKRYTVNSQKCIQIFNWSKHQAPHHTERASTVPPPDLNGALTVNSQEDLRGNPPDSLIPDSLIPDSSPSNEGEPPRAKRKPSRTSMPEDFDISDRVRDWAKEKGYENLGAHLEAFKAKVHAKGYQYVNWDSAFMEAIREDWAKLRGQGAVRGQAPPPERSSNPWWETGPGIRSKGIELGIGDWRDGAEQWHPYRNAVFKAAKARGELPEGVGI